MTASRSLLGVFLVLAMVAAACSGGDAEPTPEPTETKSDVPTPTPTPTPTATPTPTPTPEPVLFPLTGDEADDEDRLGFAALGVKIDNSPAARPQLGLDQADIVFEELVEGGITRFLGIFQSVDPDEVGPVRSGRDVDADIFPPFQGILAISGAAGPTYSVLFGAGLEVFEEGQAGGAIYRVSDRPAPHNLNAIADQLWEAGSSAGPAIEPWPFDEAIPDDGEPIEAVEARFSQEYGHSWAWREDDGVFERGQNGTRHLAASGEQVSAANVIYASVAVGAGGGVDINNAGTVSVALIGEGSATFLRDGQLFTGSWRKTSRESQFEWLDESGAPFPLAPGQTWIELQPNGFGVDSDPQGQVDADAPTPEPTAGQ